MNERIRKLWDKAATASAAFPSGQNNSWETQVNFMEKFAELIVEECMNVVTEVYRNTPLELCGPLLTATEEIAEHFYGVEEHKGWVCPKCGIDRTKAVCPKGHTAAITGDCPMTAVAQ